jgi:small ligand-binding sensory domain FIST
LPYAESISALAGATFSAGSCRGARIRKRRSLGKIGVRVIVARQSTQTAKSVRFIGVPHIVDGKQRNAQGEFAQSPVFDCNPLLGYVRQDPWANCSKFHWPAVA